ncbi:alpha/beta fold hydrolase [Flavobacterium sp. F-380]|uniref:Alpha/beta fold hydrolase n=1 Tax=Flavobacterium kayseriense TaxID=2764714 RepID=A0ABR7JAG6_9FLAO|nr:alpha/beta fold hydrolase [Flavobacterium kayseriense]MBC5842378.1 alpha/beta fold hydrolase [Flavobacterium kayseriense]MBC5848908.1 alpha/beta fold hydrolase [Flavobacterium kayseriense]
MKVNKLLFLLLLIIFCIQTTDAQMAFPKPLEGDYTIKNFNFRSGENLEELKLHYTTIGKITKDKNGQVNNAVLIMHGTTGTGAAFLSDQFGGNLFGKGQLLDATKYFIILTDDIGHGKSSKPSDGMRMKFPKYNYDDMVLANYKLLTEHLKIDHLRLVMGTSMGGMHTWVWGYTYPDFMDALMPLASLPVEIAGRNRIQRKMAIKLIEMDSEWKGGNYIEQPKEGMTGAILSLMFMVSSPLQWQINAPTRETAEAMMEKTLSRYSSILDANDLIYAFDSSRDYNPQPFLSKIKAPLVAINSADDQVNPPELGIMEKEIKNVTNGSFILLPITDKTSGHGTHSNPKIWGEHLEQLLKNTEK